MSPRTDAQVTLLVHRIAAAIVRDRQVRVVRGKESKALRVLPVDFDVNPKVYAEVATFNDGTPIGDIIERVRHA
ncbi:MAG: hypothetical protein ACK5VI_10965 [Opitutia bacterium]